MVFFYKTKGQKSRETKALLFCVQCTKSYLQAFVNSKIFPEVALPDPR